MARYKSRAKRCGEAVEEAQLAISLAEEVASAVEEKASLAKSGQPGDDEAIDKIIAWKPFTEKEFEELEDHMNTAESKVADAASEISSLYDEIDEWRSNMEEKFSQTDKYQRLEDCASQLESAKDLMESVSWPSLPAADDLQGLWEAYAESLSEVIDELTSACDEAEAAEFPGMYG